MSTPLREHTYPNGARLEISEGDITLEEVDAIVNAANAMLQHGGGVAWAIVKRGGATIQYESDEWVGEHGPVTHDKPAYTSGGNLPCKYVIHAVGPMWGDGKGDRKLAAAVHGALERADELYLGSIAFPAISTGIFGFPKDRAARIIFAEVARYFEENPQSGIRLLRLTLFEDKTVAAFLKVWDALSADKDA